MNPVVSPSVLGEILSFGLWMARQGYKESTIRPCIRALKAIAKRTNLLEPESAKAYLASAQISENRKEKLASDLARFYRHRHTPFQKRHHNRTDRLPFIPLEREVDQLISGVGKKTATFLQLLKETGVRAGEAWNLKWIDVDHVKGAVTITPEKGSRARQLKISNQLIAMIGQLSHASEYVFRNPKVGQLKSMESFSRNFSAQRKQLADRLQNLRIQHISFKTLRHLKATMEYHRTKGILHIMQLLGHKNIKNTLVYTHLVDFGSDEYVCKIAKTVDEAKSLIENGFEHVTDVDGMKLFRKRK
jgi:integrase